MHHRNVFPHDPHLGLWTGLVSAAAGDHALAAAEFAAAVGLGSATSRSRIAISFFSPGRRRLASLLMAFVSYDRLL